MMKTNKKLLALTSLVILLPVLIGCLLWSYLPEKVATHFSLSGQADGFTNRLFTMFGLPSFLLLLHWFCLFVTSRDPKSANAGRKMQVFIYWFCPAVSNILMLGIYLTAMKFINNNLIFMNLLLGLMFLVLGNYLPKTRQSYTIGLRLPWTLADKENWIKTHRMAGRLWVIGGLLILLDGFFHLSHEILTMVTLCVLIVLPVIYSYWLSRK